jgi:hypothetical protein
MYAVHQKGSQAWVLFLSPEIQSGAQGMKQESVGWGRTLRHHLTQDISMTPFLYGFQNLVLDEVSFL